MRINISEAYREEFEVFISKYRKLCDGLIVLVVKTVQIEKLITYCRHNHPDVMLRLTDTVSSRDIMRGIVNKCSITNITPLKDVIHHCRITGGERLIRAYQPSLGGRMIRDYQPLSGERMIRDYQGSLDEYLSKLKVRYLLGSSKDIFNADEIIFILDWTPDEASFLSIRHLLYEAFHHLNKNIIVQATGKKNSASIIIIIINYGHTHTHTCVSISLLLY